VKPRPIEVADEGGRALARVPLGRNNKYEPQRYVEIWKDDFDFLVKLGLSPNWACYRVKDNRYVTAATRNIERSRALVARVLLDANAGEIIRYVDGNTLNLRRENLRLVESKRGRVRSRNLVRAA
jgi:hypothetical protein